MKKIIVFSAVFIGGLVLMVFLGFGIFSCSNNTPEMEKYKESGAQETISSDSQKPAGDASASREKTVKPVSKESDIQKPVNDATSTGEKASKFDAKISEAQKRMNQTPEGLEKNMNKSLGAEKDMDKMFGN